MIQNIEIEFEYKDDFYKAEIEYFHETESTSYKFGSESSLYREEIFTIDSIPKLLLCSIKPHKNVDLEEMHNKYIEVKNYILMSDEFYVIAKDEVLEKEKDSQTDYELNLMR